MIQLQSRDRLALIAPHPEHCLDCYRLIRPGDKYYQGKDSTALFPTCHGSLLIGVEFEIVTTASGLAVDDGGGLIGIRRDGAAIVVPGAPGLRRTEGVRHLVDALVEAVSQSLPTSRQDPKREAARDRSPPGQRTRRTAGHRAKDRTWLKYFRDRAPKLVAQ